VRCCHQVLIWLTHFPMLSEETERFEVLNLSTVTPIWRSPE
jgi:hypothetical protein